MNIINKTLNTPVVFTKPDKTTLPCNTLLMYNFDSVADLVNYLNTHSVRIDKSQCSSLETGYHAQSFRRTKDWDEALDLLNHGWEEGAKKIDNRLKEKLKTDSSATTSRQRSVYDVVGGNASVPRYLQGVPTSMIRQVKKPVKQPVVDVYYNFSFPCGMTADEIIEESVATLQKVVALENSGTRVNLWATAVSGEHKITTSSSNNIAQMVKICVKRSSERLNISKLAFVVAHPAMLRRIKMGVDERSPELPTHWYHGYGYSLKGEENTHKFLEAIK